MTYVLLKGFVYLARPLKDWAWKMGCLRTVLYYHLEITGVFQVSAIGAFQPAANINPP